MVWVGPTHCGAYHHMSSGGTGIDLILLSNPIDDFGVSIWKGKDGTPRFGIYLLGGGDRLGRRTDAKGKRQQVVLVVAIACCRRRCRKWPFGPLPGLP